MGEFSEGRVWLWLLWKYDNTKYFKADEKKPAVSWLTNVVGFPLPGTKQATGTAVFLVASVLSVSNTGLLLLFNWVEIVSPLYSLSLFLNCCYSVLPESCSISLFIIPGSVKSCPKLTHCVLKLCSSSVSFYTKRTKWTLPSLWKS